MIIEKIKNATNKRSIHNLLMILVGTGVLFLGIALLFFIIKIISLYPTAFLGAIITMCCLGLGYYIAELLGWID